jgi:hypothetical protein
MILPSNVNFTKKGDFMKVLHFLKGVFSIRFYTAAQDYVTSNGTVITNSGATAALINQVGSTRFNNILGEIILPYSDTTSSVIKVPIIHCRNTPVGDAVYANLPIGSIAVQAEVTSTAITDLQFWIKGGSGASDWRKILASSETTSATAYTTAKNLVNIRGSNSGTGDFRAVYGRIGLTGAGGSGDALRGYAVTTAAATAVRGAHLTAEVGAAGSVSGTGEGARVQFSTIAGLTLNAGTVSCLNLVTTNASSVLGCTDSAHIRISDDSTYGMNAILSLGTIVGRSTDIASPGPYTYDAGGITIDALTTAKIAIRVKTPDGTFYIPGWAPAALSGT